MKRTALALVCLARLACGQPLFEYDRALPFDVETEPLSQRKDVRITGGSFQPMKGRRMDFVLVEPVGGARIRRPVVIFQHGGGQTMLNYTGEAALLAKAGAVSLILEAPYRRTSAESAQVAKGAGPRENSIHTVISIRRALDWVLVRDDIDPTRAAYVGHSYGGNAGAVLTAIDKRIKAFVLIGLVARYSLHVAENQAQYWKNYRKALSREELARTIELLRTVDPGRYLPKSAPAPVLIQCARFDMDDVKKDCELAYGAAAEPKTLRWYDVDHAFADAEASLDRLRWLSQKLKLPLQ